MELRDPRHGKWCLGHGVVGQAKSLRLGHYIEAYLVDAAFSMRNSAERGGSKGFAPTREPRCRACRSIRQWHNHGANARRRAASFRRQHAERWVKAGRHASVEDALAEMDVGGITDDAIAELIVAAIGEPVPRPLRLRAGRPDHLPHDRSSRRPACRCAQSQRTVGAREHRDPLRLLQSGQRGHAVWRVHLSPSRGAESVAARIESDIEREQLRTVTSVNRSSSVLRAVRASCSISSSRSASSPARNSCASRTRCRTGEPADDHELGRLGHVQHPLGLLLVHPPDPAEQLQGA